MRRAPQHSEAEGAADKEFHQPSGIRLPGAGAGTFSGEKIFHSLLRYVTRSSCRLGGYARSFCQRRFDSATRRETAFKSLFPMPLPFPEALRKGARDSSGRLAIKKAICAVVIILNYLYNNRPRSIGKEEEMNRPLNRRQWEGVRHFEAILEAWTEVSPIGPEAMGRTAAKVETLEATILSLEQSGRALIGPDQGYFHPPEVGQAERHPRQRGTSIGKIVGSEGFSTFKEVDPSRLTFVGYPDFDPSPYLDPRGRAVFQDPLSCRMEASDYRGPSPPRLRVHASNSQKLKLFELLDASGRLGAHRVHEVEGRFGSGLFAVVKDLSKDRLILDSRGANLLERPAQRWIKTLATGDALVKLLLGDHLVARASGNDLRDFYYLFKVSERRSARNYLSGVIPAAKISHLKALQQKGFHDGQVVVSLRTLAMGDTWAVELAQTAHLIPRAELRERLRGVG